MSLKKDNADPQSDPKLKKFLDVINSACALHGFKFLPTIKYTEQGIFPNITIVKEPTKATDKLKKE